MKTIYVADDQASIREIISGFLKGNGYQVQCFATGDGLKEVFDLAPSDMVILDVMMPGTDGITLCAKLRERSNVPIIIVSAKDSELDRITGISMGADDYLVKPFAPMELVVRVQSIFRRMDAYQADTKAKTLAYGNLTLDIPFKSCTCHGKPLDITPTEFSLLVYLFTHQERAVSREELLKHVWEFDYNVDTRACDDVLKRLRKKLTNTAVRIVTVWGFGFKLELEA